MDRLPEHAEEILKKHNVFWWEDCGCANYKLRTTKADEFMVGIIIDIPDRYIASILAEEYRIYVIPRESGIWEACVWNKNDVFMARDRTTSILEAARKIND